MAKPSSVPIRISACCIARRKKLAESKTFIQSLPYMDRLDYVSMMSNERAYCLAIENCCAVTGAGARAIRVMFDEVTRLQNHLLWLGCHALDVGAMTVFLYCFREREDLLTPTRPSPVPACTRLTTVRAASIVTCRIACRNIRRRRFTTRLPSSG